MTPTNAARAHDKRLAPTLSSPAADASLRRRSSGAASSVARPRSLRWPIASLTILLAAVNVAGASYYSLPMAERVRSPLHPWLKPSGYIGQSAGIAAVAIFVFLWLYPLRKKYKWLAFTGAVGRWLDVHVVAALALPLLLAIHAAWRFGGVIGLGFDAMMIVCASGIVGRYLYVRIPRTRSGVELTREEAQTQRAAILAKIAERSGLPIGKVQEVLAVTRSRDERQSLIRALWRMVENDFARWRMARALRRRWSALGVGGRPIARSTLDEIVRLAQREMALEQQSWLLEATQRVFRFWHVAHRPIAITALVAVIIHVAVVIALGATWFW
jgi:hypothetical protein